MQQIAPAQDAHVIDVRPAEDFTSIPTAMTARIVRTPAALSVPTATLVGYRGARLARLHLLQRTL
ncbi:hypothetical protein JF66_20740 [Cryobacterium sp. MLB-32]|nr:hypothetical protein JF66_20740 [Cryobacterium sp. MLB-32]